jgi:hypothetical protein
MSRKPDLIIEPKDFRAFLHGRFQGDADAAAAHLGVSKKLVYMLLSGSRKPSSAILKKCGLEVVFRAVRPQKGKEE